ncbi:MAG TPA: AAA family ATPase [Longimicrobiales bacterium]|nr:AAA family ATPase [Longimicrobiales bacterium]
MKLVRLYLQGFKSFANATELRFHDGITAIVGPNGCGKSNIADAIRWVLGEQRPSAMRGSRMEDTIFQGTARRRGVSRAEVALTFSNEGKRLPIPHAEVEIRRVVYREGGSDYELNRRTCRLRDIQDLFRGTGLGANAYSVIEQEMADAILSDRAEERRQLFEEAAGIGIYKDRRRTALRRLDAAEADLARLHDLIGEVESKVRSLARQRGRAQRYGELRSRRLALELAIAGAEMDAVQIALEGARSRLEELAELEPGDRAELSRAEVELARLKVESTELVRARTDVATRLEEVNREIADRERVIAVADERLAQVASRAREISGERQALRHRVARHTAEREEALAAREQRASEVAGVAQRLEALQSRQQALRDDVMARRAAAADARAKEHELERRAATLGGEAERAEARAAEAGARLLRLDAEHAELVRERDRLSEQRDLFSEQLQRLEVQKAALDAERDALAARLDSLRAEELRTREALAEAEDHANRLSARVAALEALEREHHGFAPIVAAVLDQRDQIDGMEGPLAELIQLDEGRAAAVEATLASLLQTLVVRDGEGAEAVRRIVGAASASNAAETGGGKRRGSGMLAMLPKAALPLVEALLAELSFAGEPGGEPVLIGRRARLTRLRADAERAHALREARAAERTSLMERVAAAEAELRDADARRHGTELDIRRMGADEAARNDLHTRADRMLAELAAERERLTASMAEARQQAETAKGERQQVERELKDHRERTRAAIDAVAAAEAAWEAAREELAELRVAHARAEAALTDVDRRIEACEEAMRQADRQAARLDREESERTEAANALRAEVEAASAELESLFQRRDEWRAELQRLDEQLLQQQSAAESLERRIRDLRRQIEAAGEERHRLQLMEAESRAALRTTRERLEAEWGRPLKQLLEAVEPASGEVSALRAELANVAGDLERLGPVNMLAIEEHEEESRRLEFLKAQREDLERACDDLRAAIRQINRTAREMYLETFEAIRANFVRTFQTLFEGGECDLWLADQDDPLESPIEISASPRGKRTQRIHLLSGGERALTALALLFAIYLVKPSPFCVLDEVDAPLDEANIHRFVSMLQEFKASTQFIVITHNPRTMEAADWIYGVTMQEPGVSSIVGVRLQDTVVGAV